MLDEFAHPERASLRPKVLSSFAITVVAGLAALLLASPASTQSQASGQAFALSTGNPDEKMATASRPGPSSGVNQETESADDFALTDQTALTSASFTGLIPAGVGVGDVTRVRVEIYRVFPNDSDVGRTSGPPLFSTSQVPTRVNSPSDVEFVDRDSADGNLTFTATVIAGSFTAANSVDSGIHAKPGQTTLGDGAVTGQEVRFDVTFTDPFELNPDFHYFLVPQVLLADPNQHFLWLSAPRPIVAPGTPFAPDLQEWIRNANLDPDWLRVGTDIVGSGTFNTTFSLAGIELPSWSGPAAGVAWRNHGEYVSAVARSVNPFVKSGAISDEQADAIVESAAESNCGK